MDILSEASSCLKLNFIREFSSWTNRDTTGKLRCSETHGPQVALKAVQKAPYELVCWNPVEEATNMLANKKNVQT